MANSMMNKCTSTIEKLHQRVLESKDVLNQNQCEHLLMEFKRTLDIIKENLSKLTSCNEIVELLTYDLHQVVIKVNDMVEACCTQKWWVEAIFQLHNEDAFMDILQDLNLCIHAMSTIVVDNNIHHVDGESLNLKPISQDKLEDDQNQLSERFESFLQDRRRRWCFFGRGSQSQLKLVQELMARMKRITLEQHDNGPSDVFMIDKHYLLCPTLCGKGSYGSIYKGKWLGVNCVMKLFSQEAENFQEFENYFKTEVNIITKLNHPNIVKFLGYGISKEKKRWERFIVLELMEKDLFQVIYDLSQKGKIPFTYFSAIDVMFQVAKAMCYLHKHKIYHRDLKPRNVLVSPRKFGESSVGECMYVKVANFGVSKMNVTGLIPSKLTDINIGTTIYRAPEMGSNDLPLHEPEKVDVYSSGIMCSEILSGKAPFDGVQEIKIQDLVKKGVRPKLPTNFNGLVSLINECWKLDACNRPSFQAICERLKKLKIELISSRLHMLKPTFGDKGSCTYASSSSEIVDINKEVHQSHVDISKEEGEISKLPKTMEASLVTQMDNLQQSIESHEKNILNMHEAMEGPRSPFHSQVGRSSIPAFNMDANCSQVAQDVHREFHELGLQEIAKNKKKQHENQFIELKSSSESLKEPNLTKVDGPSTYLELVTKSLKNVENMISIQSSDLVLINQLQCYYLFDKLHESLNDAKTCIDGISPQDIQRSYCILESLAQTWKEGEILVGDCCDAQWIRVAMTLANAKEHFTSLILKLRLYTQLFQSILKEGATKEFLIKLQDRKWSDDVKDEEFPIIDEKALEDKKWLLSRLIEVGSIDSENLIKRLNHPGKIDAWKVAHKSIQRVPNGQIGKGASAIVHKVVWLGKHFAEKCFFGPENKHFQKETSFLAGLSHPNILPLFCCVTTAHSCSLITELMDEDLHGLMLRKLDINEIQGVPFKLLEAIEIMLQVAEGMHYLHQNRVVHRDLKSMNILVKCNEHDGHVYAKVADFGLSQTKKSSCTYSNLSMDTGTTRWMAPELFGNFNQSVPIQVCQETKHPSLSNEQISKKYPFKVDIYSFGMVCYEILTGNIPFHNHTSMTELRKKIKDGLRPNLPKQCPQQLSNLIQACYHSDPATRPSFFEICVELRHIMCSLMIGCTL